MDPNTTLANLRKATAAYFAAIEAENTEAAAEAAEDLAVAAEALDTWLSRGGSVPRGWQWAREAS